MKDQLKAYHASKYRGLVPRIPTTRGVLEVGNESVLRDTVE